MTTGPLCVPCVNGQHDDCRRKVYDARADAERLCGCWAVLDLPTRPRARRR